MTPYQVRCHHGNRCCTQVAAKAEHRSTTQDFRIALMAKGYLASGQLINGRKEPQLSPLSKEILVRVTDGQPVKVIASDLGITRDKVDWQLRGIYRYFGVRGIAHLVHAAIREGLIAYP
jgi:DNA-binding CsgD family transcriptional regulator